MTTKAAPKRNTSTKKADSKKTVTVTKPAPAAKRLAKKASPKKAAKEARA